MASEKESQVACSEVFFQKVETGVKRWLRHTENLSDEGKRSGKDLIDFQVGNEKRSVDILNCQVGRGETPYFQVGKGEEMNSNESSCHQGVFTNGKEEKERPHPYEDSCGVSDHVNEDDEKLNTSTMRRRIRGSF
jgi:hypothetical protein